MNQKVNHKMAHRLTRWAYFLSGTILLVVVLMRYIPPISLGFDTSILPFFHAVVNTITAVVLLLALYFIKKKNVVAHQRSIYVAMGLSVIFLVSYVLYHSSTEPTIFGGEGGIKYVYYFLLLTHILAAAGIFPFILFTFIRAYTNQITKHKQMARWVFPIWLYVCISGPICYLLLQPYYTN